MNEFCSPCREFENMNSAGRDELCSTADLLPLVYNELHALAKRRLSRMKPGQTLQPTALVNEVFLRLSGFQNMPYWESRRHFFAVVAESMRRITIDIARHKKAQKNGGGWRRVELDDVGNRSNPVHEELLVIDEAMEKLTLEDSTAADVAKLKIFAGMTTEEVALSLGLSKTTAHRNWLYARAFLQMFLTTSR